MQEHFSEASNLDFWMGLHKDEERLTLEIPLQASFQAPDPQHRVAATFKSYQFFNLINKALSVLSHSWKNLNCC